MCVSIRVQELHPERPKNGRRCSSQISLGGGSSACALFSPDPCHHLLPWLQASLAQTFFVFSDHDCAALVHLRRLLESSSSPFCHPGHVLPPALVPSGNFPC